MTSFNDIRSHLITFGTTALAAVAYSPQLKGTKYSEPLRIFALTLNLNLLGELAASAFIAKGERVYKQQACSKGYIEWQETKKPITSLTLPRAMFQSAIYGLLLAAVASVAKTRKLTASSKIFTVGLPIAVVLQLLAGATRYDKARAIMAASKNLLKKDRLIVGCSEYELNQPVVEMQDTMAIVRLFTTTVLLLSCVAVRVGLTGRVKV